MIPTIRYNQNLRHRISSLVTKSLILKFFATLFILVVYITAMSLQDLKMRKVQPRSAVKIQEVLNLYTEKRLSLRKIADLTGVPKSTVGNIVRKHKMRNSNHTQDFVATSSSNSNY